AIRRGCISTWPVQQWDRQPRRSARAGPPASASGCSTVLWPTITRAELDVVFYHLTETTLEEALPPLVEKSLERGWRVAIQTGSEERRDALDARLWTYADDSFIPHGTDREPHAAEQPVVLTTGTANINNAVIRFLVDGAEPGPLDEYQRAGFLFDGHDMSQV